MGNRQKKRMRSGIIRPEPPTSPKAPVPRELGAEVFTITPTMAEQLLSGKLPNRVLNDATIERFARDMKAGAWHLNGQTIILDEQGHLLDGQHRMWAVFYADIPVKMLVVSGARRESMPSIDTGRARTYSDALRIQGGKATTLTAAAARWWHWFDLYRTGNVGSAGVPSHAELAEAIKRHPRTEEAAMAVGASRARRIVRGGVLTFVIAGAIEADEPKAAEFLEALSSGANLSSDSPVYQLREKMFAAKDQPGRTIEAMYVAAYTIKAWNAFRKGRSMKALVWGGAREKPEPFPTFTD